MEFLYCGFTVGMFLVALQRSYVFANAPIIIHHSLFKLVANIFIEGIHMMERGMR